MPTLILNSFFAYYSNQFCSYFLLTTAMFVVGSQFAEPPSTGAVLPEKEKNEVIESERETTDEIFNII